MKKPRTDPETVIAAARAMAEEGGRPVYLVGGYLRDRMLRKRTSDVDFVMEFDALEFARRFARRAGYPPPVFYGRFGTAMIEAAGLKLEFATCRKESYPEDSRKPDVVPASLAEDLARRDFTVNAMARNLSTGELLDLFHGRRDLRDKVLRTPVDPDTTFHDDPLRILRGVRFAARLRFSIEPRTKQAMRDNVPRLAIVSPERIAEELLQMLDARFPSVAFFLLDEIGALERVLPEVAAMKERRTDNSSKELLPHTFQALDNISRHTKNRYLRLAALLHDIGKPRTFRLDHGKVSFHAHEFVGEKMAVRVCQRLKVGAEETALIGRLIRFHLRPHLLAKEQPTDKGLRRFIREIGRDLKPLFTLACADLTTQNEAKARRALQKLKDLEERVREINRRDRISTFQLKIDGFAIMEVMGIPAGRAVGAIKELLENLVLEGELGNRKRELKKYLQEHRVALLAEMDAARVVK